MSRNNLIIAILAAILFLWAVNSIFTAARPRLLDLAEPFVRTSHAISNSLRSFLLNEGKLAKENRLLRDQIASLKSRLLRLEELTLENTRLKRLLGFKDRTDYKTIPAQAIGRDPSNWASIIYINKGKDDGIKKYMAATTDRGFVGRVIEVSSSTAKVMLMTDPDSKIGVLIQRTRHDGLLAGVSSQRCYMVYISLDADIWPGDLVVTSGAGGKLPKGLLVGTVEDVFIDKSFLYQSAIVKPVENLSSIEEVLCIE